MEKLLSFIPWFKKIRAYSVFFFVLSYQLLLLVWFHTLYGIDPFVRLLNHDHFIVRHWLPLFQTLLHFYFAFTHSDLGLFILMSVIAAGACAMFYTWVAFVFDRNVALISIFFVASYPTFLIISRAPYIEGLAMLLIASTLYAFEKQKWPLAWIIFLLACLTRTEAFILSIFFAIRFWQLYDFKQGLRYTILFSLPSIIGLSIFLYITTFPSSAFNPATHAIIQNIHIDVFQIAHQIRVFSLDSNIFFFLFALGGMAIILYEKKWQGVYILLPALFLIHGLLNGTSCGCYFPRTMLLAYIFFVPFFSYTIMYIYRMYPALKTPLMGLIGIFFTFNILASLMLLQSTDMEARPWRDSGVWMESRFSKDARIFVLPAYDPTGLNWSSWRYIAPLYFSKLSLEKNIVINQKNLATLGYNNEILRGDFDGIIVSEHNKAAMEATEKLITLKIIKEISRFPVEFRVFEKTKNH